MSALGWLAAALASAGAVYGALAAILAARFLARPARLDDRLPPVSLVKPLCGESAGLTRSLRSFQDQDYPAEIQLLLGVQDRLDPAVALASALPARRAVEVEVVVDPCSHGANRKVSNLINTAARASHAVLVASDSDIRVAPDYLRKVASALGAPGVGAVSCLYVGEGETGFWSRLAAMAISYQFLPSAVLGRCLGLAHPCFGSTIALNRETLARIGGFEAFADQLADDYEIGRAVRGLGLSIAIPPMVVTHVCDESSARSLIAHEIRWSRTVRLIDPAGHAGSLITHALPLALIATALLGLNPAALGLIFTTLLVRIAAKLAIDAATGVRAGPWWLLPVRDVLSFGVFLASFAGREVIWQGRRFRVGRDGVLTQL